MMLIAMADVDTDVDGVIGEADAADVVRDDRDALTLRRRCCWLCGGPLLMIAT